jgi:MATE family multidrug resistance protein
VAFILIVLQVWTSVSSLWIWAGQEEVIATLSSQSYGHGNYALTGVWLQMAMIVSTILAIPVCVTWVFEAPILEGIGFGSGQTIVLADTFAKWYLISLWPMLMFSCFSAWLNAMGVVAPIVIANAISVGISILTNYILVFGTQSIGGSWEGLGFIGSPISSGIVAWCSLIIIVFWIWWKGIHRKTWPGLFPSQLRSKKNITNYLGQALPNFVGALLENLQIQILSGLAAHLGDVEVATHNALINVYMVITCFMFGAIRATSTRVGHNLGANDIRRAKQVVWLCMTVLSVVGVLTAIILIATRDVFCRMFSNDPAVVAMGRDIMIPLALALCMYAILFAGIGALLGMGRPGIVMVAIMVGNWLVCIPLAFILTRVWKLDLLGIWVSLTVGYGVATIMIAIFLYRSDWELAAKEAVERSKHELEDEAPGKKESTPLLSSAHVTDNESLLLSK